MTRELILMVILAYVFYWVAMSAINEHHCQEYGVEYHHTGLDGTGFCEIGGIVVWAENVK